MAAVGLVRPLVAIREVLARTVSAGEFHEQLPRALRPAPRNPAARLYSDLYERSLLQTAAQAEVDLAEALLLQVVPDEVRVLTALARLGWAAAVDVVARDGNDSSSLRYATLLGREAAVALMEHSASYAARLRHLGLVNVTPVRDGHDSAFEILLAEPSVIRAVKSARGSARGPKVERYGLELSSLGELVLRVVGSDS